MFHVFPEQQGGGWSQREWATRQRADMGTERADQCCPRERSAMVEMSSTCTDHVQPLSTCNGAGMAEEMDVHVYLI